MCGINGYVNPDGVLKDDILRMNDALVHRGPDGTGHYIVGKAGLGQQRLSIIDLDFGQQPMSNEDGTVWITFNGEIYNFGEIRERLKENHQFKTKSDTEVIVHLYEEKGPQCLKELRGMFAFAIYDSRKDQLFIARDHLGQKPLYYWWDDHKFAFASEIKALLALNPDLNCMDEEALYEYLTIRIITPPRSMFKNIRKLPPAHYLIFQNGKITVNRYWDLYYYPKLTGDLNSIVEELDEKVKETVDYHLVSDVPVGAFLSGGVDSSLIVAMMSQLTSEPFKTFAGDVQYKDFSEIEYARLVSRKYGTRNYELRFLPSLIKTFPEIIWHLDEPSDSLSIAMYYIAELASKEIKVVLGGDGGDELFGGYDRYYGNVYAAYYSLLPKLLRKTVIEKVLNLLSDGAWYQSNIHKLKWIHHISAHEGGARYSKSLSYFYFSEKYFDRLFTKTFQERVNGFDPEATIKYYFDCNNAIELIDKMLYSDSMVRMPDHPIMILDRMTMAHGLESRSPFLDHKLAEFCARIPTDFKVKGKKRRIVQMELAKKYIPQEIISRKKQGFASAITYLLADEYTLLYNTFLKNSRLVEENYLNKDVIDKLLLEHQRKNIDHGQRLWLLCNAEIWYRMYIDRVDKGEIHASLMGAA